MLERYWIAICRYTRNDIFPVRKRYISRLDTGSLLWECGGFRFKMFFKYVFDWKSIDFFFSFFLYFDALMLEIKIN